MREYREHFRGLSRKLFPSRRDKHQEALSVTTVTPNTGKYKEKTIHLREPISGTKEARILLSDEARKIGLTSQVIIAECKRLIQDPFGETNFDTITRRRIDPFGEQRRERESRTINRLHTSIQRGVKEPVLVKGTGIISLPDGRQIPATSQHSDWEDLEIQYKLMRMLYLQWNKKASQEQQETLEFVPVFAVTTIGDYQFLFMKYIENAFWMVDHAMAIIGEPRAMHAFFLDENPELEAAFFSEMYGHYRKRDYVFWHDFTEKLQDILGIGIRDVAHRNILKQTQKDGRTKYFVIDQRPTTGVRI